MRAGLVILTFGYVLSQFFRSFLAVLAEDLRIDLGVGPDDLANASGLWFLAFALMQLPVGAALDKIGPRSTTALLFGLGTAGGAILFAFAGNALHINIAMSLIGVGCSPVLMASYYIFARVYAPEKFATLAALVVGIGTLGNLAGASPLTWTVAELGWRATMLGLASFGALSSIGIWIFVKNPQPAQTDVRGSVFDLLRMREMWFILPAVFVLYAPVAGIRGSWIGPHLASMGFDENAIGLASLVMALAMIIGTFFYGPLDRLLGTRKWVILAGGAVELGALCALLFQPENWLMLTSLFALIGFFGMTFPVIMAHGRAFIPAHLAGRGVTLLNMFAIGGAGILQMISGGLFNYTTAHDPTNTSIGYFSVFAFFALCLTLGLLPYLFAKDRID